MKNKSYRYTKKKNNKKKLSRKRTSRKRTSRKRISRKRLPSHKRIKKKLKGGMEGAMEPSDRLERTDTARPTVSRDHEGQGDTGPVAAEGAVEGAAEGAVEGAAEGAAEGAVETQREKFNALVAHREDLDYRRRVRARALRQASTRKDLGLQPTATNSECWAEKSRRREAGAKAAREWRVGLGLEPKATNAECLAQQRLHLERKLRREPEPAPAAAALEPAPAAYDFSFIGEPPAAAAPAAAGEGTLQRLLDMGFNKEAAQAALRKNQNDLISTVESLLR